ncbi:phosphopantetheine-binding protein [Paenibacillus sp. P96]|uniref:Phosphopantetheine-binding protein n=1 Tax=Paenibacillus zeirhizosphaerae TaxID=2987519 RepID=A0ABT9FLV4_9BACL|nr:phosphopantetheine-binding protein [Paenibacillus sp. P96]MDP4095721.1 phosphopantetheine-binding protein [Paenibacillus sp. P96]
MQSQVIRMISEAKEDPGLADKLNGGSDIIHDAGLDSLQLVHFMLKIEDEFDVEIDFDAFELEYLSSIDIFCSYVRDMRGQAGFTESTKIGMV